MTQVIGRAEEVVKFAISFLFIAFHILDSRMRVPYSIILCFQHHPTLLILGIANLTVLSNYIGLIHKLSLVAFAQQTIIPIADGLVQLVRYVVNHENRIGILRAQLVTTLIIISVVVGLHIAQRHSTVGCRCDGKWNLLFLCRGIGRSCECRDILFIYIDATSDKPIMGRRCDILIFIDTAIGITVVNNLLGVMHKVTRGLNSLKIGLIRRT